MTQVNISDAKEHFNDWLELLLSGQQDKIIVTANDKFQIRMTLEELPIKRAANRQPGLGKGKFTFDDKLFDELGAENFGWRELK